jgi:hypothetical protein
VRTRRSRWSPRIEGSATTSTYAARRRISAAFTEPRIVE